MKPLLPLGFRPSQRTLLHSPGSIADSTPEPRFRTTAASGLTPDGSTRQIHSQTEHVLHRRMQTSVRVRRPALCYRWAQFITQVHRTPERAVRAQPVTYPQRHIKAEYQFILGTDLFCTFAGPLPLATRYCGRTDKAVLLVLYASDAPVRCTDRR